MDDFTCDLNCPVDMKNGAWCCQKCHIKRKNHVDDTNKDMWSDEFGFCSSVGCRLERNMMPPECRSYDCKKGIFDVWQLWWKRRRWNGIEWEDSVPVREDGFGNIKESVINDR